MAQANTTLSRRTLIATMAALPATALPAIASVQAGHLDADLIALDGHLDRLIQEYHYVNNTDLGPDSDEIVSYFNDRQDALVKKIISMSARSAAGPAVQTKAISLYEIALWHHGDECYPFLLQYLNSACATLGVTPAALCGPNPTTLMLPEVSVDAQSLDAMGA